MRIIYSCLTLLMFLLSCSLVFAQQSLTAVKVSAAPVIDGKASEDFWRQAKAVTVHDQVAKVDIQLKAAHDGENIYLLAEFPDADESRLHRALIWTPEENTYQNGPTREDTLVLKWSMSSHDSGLTLKEDRPYRADIWYWKADRTDHAGFADDKIQFYTTTRDKKAKLLISNSGKVFYLQRSGDQGTSAYKPKLQTEYGEDLVAKYERLIPTGSRADVRAKGHWQDGRWVIEFARKLETGHSDDLQMELFGVYRFGISRYEIAGRDPEPETESAVPLFGSGEINEILLLNFQP